VRAAALGALARAGGRRRATAAWRIAMTDPEPAVRRRAADLAPGLGAPARPLLTLLGDVDVTVIEASAWALGELGPAAVRARAVPALAAVAGTHDDSLAREAAVAALGGRIHCTIVADSAPDARGVATAALAELRSGATAGPVRPLYLRPPDVTLPKQPRPIRASLP